MGRFRLEDLRSLGNKCVSGQCILKNETQKVGNTIAIVFAVCANR